jgi:hypothetical protein
MSKTFSISVRLKRVTLETAHVSVTLHAGILKQNPNGSATVDAEKLMHAAIDLGHLPSTVWTAEGEPQLAIHAVQSPADRAIAHCNSILDQEQQNRNKR